MFPSPIDWAQGYGYETRADAETWAKPVSCAGDGGLMKPSWGFHVR